MKTTVLIATAGAGHAPAALLPWAGRTVIGRLLDQVADLGLESIVVITRPRWNNALSRSLDGRDGVELTVSQGTADDLRAIARLARSGTGGILLVSADVVIHAEALRALVEDSRLPTGALCAGTSPARAVAFPARTVRGRVMSASSPYHEVARPTAQFLDVLKVAPRSRAALAGASDELAGVVEPLATAAEDAVSLALVGLVRSGVHVGVSGLGGFFWARPQSAADARDAAREITRHDEDRARLDSAVKPNDGFFTTFFVSPYSKYMARWAARHGLTPNQVTIASLAIGLVAAAAFATGERPGLVAGAVLLQLSFTTDCVDGQLARYTRSSSRLGAWLDSILDRAKEYAVFAGLAIGSAHIGDPVWVLAGAALALQTVRHAIDATYPIVQHQALAAFPQPPLAQASDVASGAEGAPASNVAPAAGIVAGGLNGWRRLNRWPGVEWLKKIVAFPIGERFAVISITAAVSSARTTFVVLLAWSGFATAYKMAGRVLRSVAR